MSRTASPRAAFLAAGLALGLGGAALFVFAESVATLPAARSGNAWPWPIGPLALRFVAAGLLAAAVMCLLTSLRPDAPTLAAFGTLAAIPSSLFLLHAAVNVGRVDWSRPLASVWLALLAIAFVGGTALAFLARRRAVLTSPPLPPTPVAAQRVNRFISVLTALVGSVLFLLPDLGRSLWPWDLGNSVNVQLLGGLFLAVAASALWVWRQPSWYGYDLQYAAAGTFAAVALVASFMHWGLFVAKPITSLLFVATYLLGAFLGFYPFYRYALGSIRRPAVTVTTSG